MDTTDTIMNGIHGIPCPGPTIIPVRKSSDDIFSVGKKLLQQTCVHPMAQITSSGSSGAPYFIGFINTHSTIEIFAINPTVKYSP
jgi:hypothetical protein